MATVHEISYIIDYNNRRAPEQRLPPDMTKEELHLQLTLGTLKDTLNLPEHRDIIFAYCPVCEKRAPLEVRAHNVPDPNNITLRSCQQAAWFINKYVCLACGIYFQKQILKDYRCC